jgi:hypothetical protein
MTTIYPVTAEAALTELLLLMRRSFPHYLKFAHPYVRRVDGEREAVLDDIVVDQAVLADRAAEQLDALGATPPNVEFPMEFTDAHDLSIDYLVDRAIRYQRTALQVLDDLAKSLVYNQSVRSLVDEARGMARAHLELLQECHRDA